MTSTRITFETVTAAAEEIEGRGETASVRKVVAMLGGSPNSISPLLKKWREGRPDMHATQVAIDPRIAALIADQVKTAAVEASRDAEVRLSEVQDDADLIAEAGRAAEQLAAELAVEIEAARAKVLQQSGQIEQMKADTLQVKADAVERVQSAEDRATATVTKAEASLAREIDAHEVARRALARAETKLEVLPRLEGDLEVARAEAKQARTEANAAERDLAAVRAELKSLQSAFERQSAEIAELKAAMKDERKRADAAERELMVRG
ncbi:MAG: DNA-binding protein [Azoarcus sp.]|nr:DNA-binding protein [Azoarcus sp.]